jgi:hypothetical protein
MIEGLISHKTSAQLRAEKIPEKVRDTFIVMDWDAKEALRISLKINELIEKLPEDRQSDESKKLLNLLNTSKDLFYYGELHDQLLKEVKNSTPLVSEN